MYNLVEYSWIRKKINVHETDKTENWIDSVLKNYYPQKVDFIIGEPFVEFN